MHAYSRQVVVTRFGGVKTLQLETVERPEPRAGEVRLQVELTGVSFADLLMREGIHPEVWLRRPPFVLGWEVVGLVDRLGMGVTGWQTGQRAVALTIVGGYAEYVCLPSTELIPVPPDLDAADALCMAFNYATAFQMLHRSARVTAGERALVHSAAGGVGSALVELGRLAGLELYGTASRRKHALLADYGCTAIDYQAVDFVEAVRELTQGQGVDVVFDGIGGAHLRRSYQVLKRGGRLIAYGLSAALPQDGRSRWPLIARTLGEWLFAFAPNLIPDGRSVHLYSIQTLKRRRPQWYRDDVAQLLRWLAEGKLKPVVAGRLPLEDAARAHELLASGDIVGKLLLEAGASQAG